jgi:signal transduction histidine kinase/FixJ family two-component response regulator
MQSIDQATDLVLEERIRLTRAVANSIDDALNHYAKDTGEISLSGLLDVQVDNPRPKREALKNLYSHLTVKDNFAFVSVSRASLMDLNNTLLWTEPPLPGVLGQSLGASPQFQQAAQSGEYIIFEAASLTDAARPVARIFVPVKNLNGQVSGMVAVDVDADVGGQTYTPLAEEDVKDDVPGLESLRMLQDSGYGVEIINSSGTVLAAQEEHVSPGQTSHHMDIIAPLLKDGQSGVVRHKMPEGTEIEDHIVVFVPLGSLPWVIILEQDEDVVMALVHALRQRLILFGGVAFMAILALAWITTSSVVKPVRSLTLASRKIADGDLEQPVTLSGTDEIGQLARAFDEMRIRLRASQKEIEQWSHVLEERVQQRTKELSALFEASQALTSTLELDTLFAILMAKTREIFPLADAGVLFLYNPDADRLEAKAFFGFQPDLPQTVKLRPGEDGIGQVFASGKPLVSSSATMSYHLWETLSPENRPPGVASSEVRDIMCVPLRYEDRTTGSFALYIIRRSGSFSDSDTRLLQAFANQAAIAIENARLFTEASTVGTLRELDQLKTEFVARASHELRNPLASAKSLVETLIRPDINLKTREQKEFLEGINNACDRLTGIIDKLLTVSRIEAGQLEIDRDSASIEPMIQEAVGRLQSQEPAARFQVNIADNLLPALADPHRLEDVLDNLLSNAVKYSPNNEPVVISARNSGDMWVEVSVIDRGIGIPLEDQPKLFQRFSRVDSPDGRRVGGVGLGLYICRSYVEAMGGQIWSRSLPGEGSSFTFKLPAARAGDSPASSRRVIIVDDEYDVVRATQLNLEAAGFQVLSAYDGRNGMSVIKEQKPDVIVLDIAMPDADGLEMARELRAQPDTRNIPVIFLTAKTQVSDELEGWRVGGDGYIRKPFSPAELSRTVASVLRLSPRARRQRRLQFIRQLEKRMGQT